MYILYITLLIISCAGIFFILASKISEIKNGQTGVFGRLSASADPMFRRLVGRTRAVIGELTVANVKKILTAGSHGLFHIFGTAGLFVSKHHKRLTSRVNGKREIKGGGVVSFFLKRVAESSEEKKDEQK